MRREDVAALLPIIKAWGEGKEIQMLVNRFPDSKYRWDNLENHTKNPHFSAGVGRYRIAPEKKKGWINIYKNSNNGDVAGGYIYPSKEAAGQTPTAFDRVACIEIEYEEGQGL